MEITLKERLQSLKAGGLAAIAQSPTCTVLESPKGAIGKSEP
jgi:hypothetical protein